VKTILKPTAQVTPTVSVEERFQRIKQEWLTEAAGAQDTPAVLSRVSPQDQEMSTIDAIPGKPKDQEDSMEVQQIANKRSEEAPSAPNNLAMSTNQQSSKANTRTTIKVSPQITDVDVVMVDAEEDNDGFDVFGLLFKVYPKPKPARKHMVQYDIKLLVIPCEATEALTELSKVLVSIWTVLQNADKKLVIYTWKDGSPFAPLQRSKICQLYYQTLAVTSTEHSRKRSEALLILVCTWDTKSRFKHYKRNWHGGSATKDLSGI
jgi:hypothetical protein